MSDFGPPVDTFACVDVLPLHRLPKLSLAAAYCYEIEGETLIPDSVFDYLSLGPEREWDRIPDPLGHMAIIKREALNTSTANYLSAADYPPWRAATRRRCCEHGANTTSPIGSCRSGAGLTARSCGRSTTTQQSHEGRAVTHRRSRSEKFRMGWSGQNN